MIGIEITTKFKIPDFCDKGELEDFGTLRELLDWVIAEEGVMGLLVEGDVEIVDIKQLDTIKKVG